MRTFVKPSGKHWTFVMQGHEIFVENPQVVLLEYGESFKRRDLVGSLGHYGHDLERDYGIPGPSSFSFTSCP